MLEIGQIQSVQPNHGPGSILAVVVPVHCRGEDDIAPLHFDAATVDGCEAALALDDEAHGEGDVAVGFGGLVGHY